MRIGFVTDDYRPYVSGVINFISLNRRYLEERGHEVWIFGFGSPVSRTPQRRRGPQSSRASRLCVPR
jgi:hypothetical protein